MRIVVALITDAGGRVLLVRKRGTSSFMQPGGKIEPGEEPRAALSRELAEELALTVTPSAFEYLARASAPASNEPGITVHAEIYGLQLDGVVTVRAEIEEALWIDPANTIGLPLAPLTRDHVLPLCGSVRRSAPIRAAG